MCKLFCSVDLFIQQRINENYKRCKEGDDQDPGHGGGRMVVAVVARE